MDQSQWTVAEQIVNPLHSAWWGSCVVTLKEDSFRFPQQNRCSDSEAQMQRPYVVTQPRRRVCWQEDDGSVWRGREPPSIGADAPRAADREGRPGSSEPASRSKRVALNVPLMNWPNLHTERMLKYILISCINHLLITLFCSFFYRRFQERIY